MPNSSKRKPLAATSCPGCGELGLQKIIYGMPSGDFDFEKYMVGGCMPSEKNVGCRACGWSGTLKELKENS